VSFGVWDVAAGAFCQTVFGQIERYDSLPEADAACVDWRKADPTGTFEVRQMTPGGHPYEGPGPVTVKERY
jgi:hypothetical protein